MTLYELTNLTASHAMTVLRYMNGIRFVSRPLKKNSEKSPLFSENKKKKKNHLRLNLNTDVRFQMHVTKSHLISNC